MRRANRRHGGEHMLCRKRLHRRVVSRMQVKRPGSGELRGARLTGKFSGSKRNGRMPRARRSAVKGSLHQYVTHDAPDTRPPPSEASVGTWTGTVALVDRVWRRLIRWLHLALPRSLLASGSRLR